MKYHHDRLDVSSLGANNIDRLQLEMIPESSSVLEIGCATGYMSQYLVQEKGCRVLAVEKDVKQAAFAEERGIDVLLGGVEDDSVHSVIEHYVREKGPFDVVFMSQVIEHLVSPEVVLEAARDWLGDGMLIVSTCNIAHWKCRFRLLCGIWQYEDYGICDRDHVRFFTLKSFPLTLEHCGYEVVDYAFSFQDFCPIKLLFGFRLLAPSDILRCIPFIGLPLRKKYLHMMRNGIATQFVYSAQVRRQNKAAGMQCGRNDQAVALRGRCSL